LIRTSGPTAYATIRTPPPPPRPNGPVCGAQHRVGQCERAAERGAARQRLREVQVSTAAAAKDGARSRVWEAHAAASSFPHGSRGRTAPTRRLPVTRARSASLSSTSRPCVDSALGFGTSAPGARLQHELPAEIERAKHRALWVRARAVRPPGNDATTWHAAENAEYLKAYAGKAAFECACGISQTMPTAWPGTDTARRPPGPWGPRAEHTCRRPHRSTQSHGHPGWRMAQDRSVTARWTAGPRISALYTASFPGNVQGPRDGTTASAMGYTARPSEQPPSRTANTPQPRCAASRTSSGRPSMPRPRPRSTAKQGVRSRPET
jgi:hypothetical protein